jgi:DNA/RNA-binding domain of Phe-tRNA-synthetase-like protein
MSSDLKNHFPDLTVLSFSVRNVEITKKDDKIERFKEEIFKEIREKYSLETLKDVSIFRAYRDFFWKVGIDPTKNRPASEALIRRILAGKPIPNINTLVDAYNLASIKSQVPIAAFDEDKLKGEPAMRFAFKDESFLGIGMEKPMQLDGGEIVISDSRRLIAVYPYRDADYSKVTEETKNVLVLICGVPGIYEETLKISKQTAAEYINRFCSGIAQS